MTKEERVETIRQRWMKFEYKGQADHDVRFLLTLVTGSDPDYTWEIADIKVVSDEFGEENE